MSTEEKPTTEISTEAIPHKEEQEEEGAKAPEVQGAAPAEKIPAIDPQKEETAIPTAAAAEEKAPEKTPEKAPEPVLGLDFGCKYIVASIGFDSDRLPYIVPNELNNLITPSVVGFSEWGRVIGEAAATEWARQPSNFCGDVKTRLLNDVSDPLLLRGHELLPQQVGAMLLVRMRRYARDHYARQFSTPTSPELNKCVIALPAWALNGKCPATVLDAAKIAGLDVAAFVADTTAAAVCHYALHPPTPASTDDSEGEQKEKKNVRNVLFVDCGEGNFSAAVVGIEPGTLTVKGVASTKDFGGAYVDRVVMDDLLGQFCTAHKVDRSCIPAKPLLRLKNAVEKAKTILSTIPSTQVIVEAFYAGIDLSYTLTSEAIAAATCGGTSSDTGAAVIRKVLSEAIDAATITTSSSSDNNNNESFKGIDAVEIIGGGVRAPFVQNIIAAALTEKCNWPADRPLSRSLDGSSAVATGCGLVAQMVTGHFPLKLKVEGDTRIISVDKDSKLCSGSALSDEDIKRYAEAEAAFLAEDEYKVKCSEKRHELERYISDTKASCSDPKLAEYVSEEEKASIRALLTVEDDWVVDNPMAEIATTQDRIDKIKAAVAAAAPRLDTRMKELAEARLKEIEEAKKAPPPKTDGSTAAKRQPRTPKERIEMALKRKEQGNQQFKEGAYAEANLRYTQGVTLLDELDMRQIEGNEEMKKQANELKVTLHVNIALTLQKTGAANNRIMENCNKALAIDPNHVKALFRRAQAYVAMKDITAAEKDINKILKIDKDNAPAKKELAHIRKLQKAELERQKKLSKAMFSMLGSDD